MKSKLIIFDSDGVLVDSEKLIKEALVEVCLEQDIDMDLAWAYRMLQGLRPDDTYRAIEDYAGRKIDVEKAQATYRRIFRGNLETRLKPTMNIVKHIGYLHDEGISKCVATSANLEMTYKKFDICRLSRYFEKHHIFSGQDVEKGKPHPDLMLHAAENMKFDPKDCIVIEDAAAGIKAAKSAGMTAIGYVGGSHGQYLGDAYIEHLYDAGADKVIDHHDKLIETLA